MIEPSNQDFGDTPNSVREYVYGLEERIAELEAKSQRLVGLVLRMIDRWWCFVHSALPSKAARNLHKEALDALEGSDVLIQRHNLEQQAKGLEDYVSSAMEHYFILHLNEEVSYHNFLIGLNVRAKKLRKQAPCRVKV